MANRVNNWEQLLGLANEDLKQYNTEIAIVRNNDGDYDVIIDYGDVEDTYASGYYEDELGELVNEAWAHARAKIKAKQSGF